MQPAAFTATPFVNCCDGCSSSYALFSFLFSLPCSLQMFDVTVLLTQASFVAAMVKNSISLFLFCFFSSFLMLLFRVRLLQPSSS